MIVIRHLKSKVTTTDTTSLPSPSTMSNRSTRIKTRRKEVSLGFSRTTRNQHGHGILRRRHPPYSDVPKYETPRKMRPILTAAYQNGTADDKRKVLVQEVGEYLPEIDLQDFIAYILPSLKRGINVKKILSTMKTEADSLISASHRTWRSFRHRCNSCHPPSSGRRIPC